MLIGMTGFARISGQIKDTHINLEIRSLNHRFLECLVHSPDGFTEIEELIKNQVKSRMKRGRVTVVLSLTNLHPRVSVDYTLAQGYLKKLKELLSKFKKR